MCQLRSDASVAPELSDTQPDVFISHSSKDRAAAYELRKNLTEHGLVSWMAPDDLPGGVEWGEQIVEAIKACRAVVVLVSAAANASDHVSREIRLATSNKKPVLPVRLEGVHLERTMEYDLALVQRVDAFPPPFGQYLDRIRAQLGQLLGAPAEGPSSPNVEAKGRFSLTRRRALAAAVAALAILAIGAVAWAAGGRLAGHDPHVRLQTVSIVADGVRAEGSYENLSVGRDKVLFIGQPQQAATSEWLPVEAQLFPISEADGWQSGRWSVDWPGQSVGYTWQAIIAHFESGASGTLDDVRLHGPQSVLVSAASEVRTTP